MATFGKSNRIDIPKRASPKGILIGNMLALSDRSLTEREHSTMQSAAIGFKRLRAKSFIELILMTTCGY
jgi:hypothetical protein